MPVEESSDLHYCTTVWHRPDIPYLPDNIRKSGQNDCNKAHGYLYLVAVLGTEFVTRFLKGTRSAQAGPQAYLTPLAIGLVFQHPARQNMCQAEPTG
jgi:hypothetical protein